MGNVINIGARLGKDGVLTLPFPQDSSLSLALTLSCKEALQHSSFLVTTFS